MFNVGVIAARPSEPLVKLTSRFVGFVAYPQVVFGSDGMVDVAGLGYVTGEWYVPGPLAAIGSSYQIRYTLQAGIAPLTGPADVVDTTWRDITVPLYQGRRIVWDAGQAGRVLIEIRHKATGVVQAAAQFWSKASCAP